MKFVQHITFKTSRFDEMQKLMEEDSANEGAPGNPQFWILKDRDNADTYRVTVVFDSYEQAMQNNDRPETQDFAAKMQSLVDGDIVWGNFDLLQEG
jgi:quinol monooxygenase YgiN